MTFAQSQPYVPLEEFLEMVPEPFMKLEWCAGVVYAMSGGSPEHARLCARVATVLSQLLGQDCTLYGSNADLWVDAVEFYGQADASIVCGALHTHVVKKGDKTFGEAITNPVVLVEVLSPSTETRDRGEKFEAYKWISSLKEYVLVSQDERRIEVRRRGERGWSVDVAAAGQSVKIHGHLISVDAVYG
jgi:Uma2 family endonuclease